MIRIAASLVAVTIAMATLAGQDRRPAPSGPAASPRRLALVIGNDAYASGALKNAAADARAVGGALRDAGYAVTELVDATQAAVDRELGALVGRVTSDAEVVVFYAGHGVQIEGENYLLPVELPMSGADASEVKYRSLPAGKILDRLAAARVRVLILDACRDNPFAATRSAPGGLASLQAVGALVAFATGPGQTASDNPAGGNGLFTKHLLPLLRQPGLSAVELFRRVRQGVYDESGGRQVPWLSDGLIGDFSFGPSSTNLPRANLTVQAEPSGASIFVDGQPRGVASPTLVIAGLTVGDHTVVARREGYAEARRPASVPAAGAWVALTLVATNGALRIETTPAGAEVTVDGLSRGQSPLDLAGLAPGAHRVEATLRGHIPFYSDVTVTAGTTSPVRASLAPEPRAGADAQTGILYVASEPTGAQVYLDGTLIGTTPHTLEGVPAGAHALRVTRQYYAPAEARVMVEPKVVTRERYQMDLLKAELLVESDLTGASMSVDGGAPIPLQPTLRLELTAGRHRVVLTHLEAGAITHDVDLPGGTSRVAFRSAALMGSLTVLSDLPLTTLIIGSRRVTDMPPVTVTNLPKGKVTLLAFGAKSYRKEVEVVAGDTVVVRLTDLDIAPGIKDKFGVTWVLIPPGVFEMGCPADDGVCVEKTARQVTISRPFEMMATEVSRGVAAASGLAPISSAAALLTEHPLTSVSWSQALEICSALGGRLPTEAEWEYAARSGRSRVKFPWGDSLSPLVKGLPSANLFDESGRPENPGLSYVRGYNDGSARTAPVASFQSTEWGLFDMAGNVKEWVADWASSLSQANAVDPTGPADGSRRSLRGSSWYSAIPHQLHVSHRASEEPQIRSFEIGVRCVREVVP